MKTDVAAIVTERILESMKSTGSIIWQRPWRILGYRNAVSKKAYRGINVLMLSLLGADEWYLTFNQAKAHGGNVKKGSKGIPIVFYKVSNEEKNDAGDVIRKKFFMLRYYTVFGLSQTENVKINLPVDEKLEFVPVERAEALIKASGVTVTHGGNRAFYTPALHTVTMPPKENFKSVEHYYATLFHELTHWTSKEVGITLDGHFGDEQYSKEELTAEIGANFLLSYCGIDASATYNNSVAYLQSWISKLSDDPKLLIQASNAAQKRFDWLLAKVNPGEIETDEVENIETVAIAA